MGPPKVSSSAKGVFPCHCCPWLALWGYQGIISKVTSASQGLCPSGCRNAIRMHVSSCSSKMRAFMSYVDRGLSIWIAVWALLFESQCNTSCSRTWRFSRSDCNVGPIQTEGTQNSSLGGSRPLVTSCDSDPRFRGRETLHLIHIAGFLFLWLRDGFHFGYHLAHFSWDKDLLPHSWTDLYSWYRWHHCVLKCCVQSSCCFE